MTIVVCLDDRNGMTFAGRRQSMDSRLRQEMLALCADTGIWMDTYSAGQFQEPREGIRVDEDFLMKAEPGDVCFVEKADIRPVADKISKLVIYRWNRHYPSDKKFPAELFADKWTRLSQREFPGSSHECITEEVYSV